MSISLEHARKTQDGSGGEVPAYDDEGHTPNLRGTVRYPGIADMEVDDRKEEVKGIESGLKGWLDAIRLVGGGQIAQVVGIVEEENTDDPEHDYPNQGRPRAFRYLVTPR
jgi:hypothetical protein